MIRGATLSATTIVSAILALGCGNNRLLSIGVSPAAADAKNFPGGKVQFTASGTFANSPRPVPLTNVTWCIGTAGGICNGNIAPAAAIDANGVAQCLSSSGRVTVLAGVHPRQMNPDTGQQLRTFGSAQLACP